MLPNYKLTDLLGSAGATIGVIISGTIFLQFISTKYVDLSGRYRALTGEQRRGETADKRREPLKVEIEIYRKRLQLLSWASWLGAVALLHFLSAVLLGGLSMMFPQLESIRLIGTLGLGFGLILIAVAVVIELYESILAAREVQEEIADF